MLGRVTSTIPPWLVICATLSTATLVGCAGGGGGHCSFNSDCPAGHYCRASMCASDCTNDTACVTRLGSGAVCSSFGMCIAPTDSDSGVGADGGPGIDSGVDAGPAGPLRVVGGIVDIGERRSSGTLTVVDDGFVRGDRVCVGTLCTYGGIVP